MSAKLRQLFAIPWVSASTFWLHVGIALFALTQCLAAKGQIRIFLALALIFPLLRLLVDASWRERRIEAIRRIWCALDDPNREGPKWQAGFAWIGLPTLILYSLQPFFSIASGDSWAALPTAVSLVREGNFEISEFVPLAGQELYFEGGQKRDLPYGVLRTESGIYSRYPVGMTLWALPFAVSGKLLGANFDELNSLMQIERLAAMVLASTLLATFFRGALLFGTKRSAFAVSVLLAVGSGIYSTVSQALWQHGGVMLGMSILILLVAHPRWKYSILWSIAFSFAAGWMFACRLTALPTLAVLLFGLLLFDWRRGIVASLATVLGILPWALLYYAIYGTPLGPSFAQGDGSNWTADIGAPLIGLLVSPARGLILYQPWVLFAPLGFLLWKKTSGTPTDSGVLGERPASAGCFPLYCHEQPADAGRSPGRFAASNTADFPNRWLLAALALVHLLVIAAWKIWWGGSCWGSRLLTEMFIPLGLLMLPIAERLLALRWGRWIFGFVLVLSFIPQMSGVWFFGLHANWTPADRSELMWLPPAW